MASNSINALAPWFGGKRTMAPKIIEAIGRHTCYWEPFCGSMAVLMVKPPVAMETVNDMHGDLVNLARVVRDRTLGPVLYRRLRRTLAAKALLDESAGRWKAYGDSPAPDSPDVDRAYDYFLTSWLGRNGVSGTESYNQGFSLRFTKNGGHSATRWASAVDSIPAWRERLRSVTILNQCGIGLCERIEDARGVAIYADPPYLKKGAKYRHDFTPIQHVRLSAALRRFRFTRVVVSYYEHPNLVNLYPGWHKAKVKATKALVSQGMRDATGATEAPEVLLSNLPFPAIGFGCRDSLFD
jgi:DNA adenine methylase